MIVVSLRLRGVIAAIILGLFALTASRDAGAQTLLSVSGDVPRSLTLTAAELKDLPRTTVTVTDSGHDVKYTGVLVAEVLAKAGVALGRALSGTALTTYVTATAKDDYQVVFSLAELDPALTSSEIIVADSVDGQPLPDNQGPFRIVVPHDKRGARWVRMVERLEVVRLRK